MQQTPKRDDPLRALLGSMHLRFRNTRDQFLVASARCHAWSYDDEKGETQYTTVLELPPVDSAENAVKARLRQAQKSHKGAGHGGF